MMTVSRFLARRLRSKLPAHLSEVRDELRLVTSIDINNTEELVDFFNKADAINKRMHQIELIPGFGKKHMQEIIKQREEKEFESFEDMKKRISE